MMCKFSEQIKATAWQLRSSALKGASDTEKLLRSPLGQYLLLFEYEAEAFLFFLPFMSSYLPAC